MKWHRRHIPALLEPLETTRFHLRRVSFFRALALHYKINASPKVLESLTLDNRKRSLLSWYKYMGRVNGRSRMAWEIIDRESGKMVGFHTIRLLPYKSAWLLVAILDETYWGKGVTEEVRKALLPFLAANAGVECFKAQVSSRNFASIFNHLNLGFRQVGIHSYVGYNAELSQPRDNIYFELMRDDFPAYFTGASDGEN